jgi:hypothetical protein
VLLSGNKGARIEAHLATHEGSTRNGTGLFGLVPRWAKRFTANASWGCDLNCLLPLPHVSVSKIVV